MKFKIEKLYCVYDGIKVEPEEYVFFDDKEEAQLLCNKKNIKMPEHRKCYKVITLEEFLYYVYDGGVSAGVDIARDDYY